MLKSKTNRLTAAAALLLATQEVHSSVRGPAPKDDAAARLEEERKGARIKKLFSYKQGDTEETIQRRLEIAEHNRKVDEARLEKKRLKHAKS